MISNGKLSKKIFELVTVKKVAKAANPLAKVKVSHRAAKAAKLFNQTHQAEP